MYNFRIISLSILTVLVTYISAIQSKNLQNPGLLNNNMDAKEYLKQSSQLGNLGR